MELDKFAQGFLPFLVEKYNLKYLGIIKNDSATSPCYTDDKGRIYMAITKGNPLWDLEDYLYEVYELPNNLVKNS